MVISATSLMQSTITSGTPSAAAVPIAIIMASVVLAIPAIKAFLKKLLTTCSIKAVGPCSRRVRQLLPLAHPACHRLQLLSLLPPLPPLLSRFQYRSLSTLTLLPSIRSLPQNMHTLPLNMQSQLQLSILLMMHQALVPIAAIPAMIHPTVSLVKRIMVDMDATHRHIQFSHTTTAHILRRLTPQAKQQQPLQQLHQQLHPTQQRKVKKEKNQVHLLRRQRPLLDLDLLRKGLLRKLAKQQLKQVPPLLKHQLPPLLPLLLRRRLE